VQSVHDRLVRLAHQRDIEPNLVFSRFAAERLLYRLSASRHVDRFVLKGAFLLVVWLGEAVRPTRDVDLLGFGNLPAEALREITDAVLKTIAAFLNTEGGDLLIGVADDRTVLGIQHDRLDDDDKFMRHLAQAVRNGLGDQAGTGVDPKTQIVEGKTLCLVSCQRSPEPVFLRWKGLEKAERGDFYVRSGPSTVRLSAEATETFIATRFGSD
jgi:hypothetical protein